MIAQLKYENSGALTWTYVASWNTGSSAFEDMHVRVWVAFFVGRFLCGWLRIRNTKWSKLLFCLFVLVVLYTVYRTQYNCNNRILYAHRYNIRVLYEYWVLVRTYWSSICTLTTYYYTTVLVPIRTEKTAGLPVLEYEVLVQDNDTTSYP